MNRAIRTFVILLLASVSAFATVHSVSSERTLRNLSACASTDTVVLTHDITMTQDFTPMCKNGFYGVFDGANHTILNLKISENMWLENNIAFIAILGEGGMLKNITFANPEIKGTQVFSYITPVSDVSIAVAVGELRGGSVENIHVTSGTVSVEGKNRSNFVDAGGLVGTVESGTISNCDVSMNVTNSGRGSANVGGICGNVTGDVTLNSVTYTGNADALIGAGGNNVTSVDKYGAITVSGKGSAKTAVIDGVYTDSHKVEIPQDVVVNSVTLNRTFNAGKVATLYVPFEIDAAKVNGAAVYKFKTVVKNEEDGRWKFKVSTAETVKPNTPYVILPTGTQVTFDITDPVTLNTTTEGEATAANNWEFVGAYQYEKFTINSDNPIYVFADKAQDGAKLGEFVKIAEGAFINPMRAYLVYHKSEAMQKSAHGNFGTGFALPDELDIEIENENGIVVQTGTLNTVTCDVRMDRWFDLKGRRLNSRPTAKGTYYKNGKRVVIR